MSINKIRFILIGIPPKQYDFFSKFVIFATPCIISQRYNKSHRSTAYNVQLTIELAGPIGQDLRQLDQLGPERGLELRARVLGQQRRGAGRAAPAVQAEAAHV